MVMITLLIGIISSAVLGWIGGIVIAAVAFVGWYRFNMRAATTGLFKANLNSYFTFRQRGLGVDEALRAMVTARYSFPSQRARKDTVLMALEELARIPPGSDVPPSRIVIQPDPEKLRVTQAVMYVFAVENGNPPLELAEKYHNEILTLYEQFQARYGVGKQRHG
jgi:hypothetical protein